MGERSAADDSDADLDVLIKVTDPQAAPIGRLALDLVRHERDLPHVEHVGEVARTRRLRWAIERGFDDAAFEDRSGRLSEATIWNLALWHGESVVWPRADILVGAAMRTLARRLDVRGIPQRTLDVRSSELTDRLAGVVMNPWTPGVSIARIGEHVLARDPALVRLSHDVHADEPPLRP